MDEPISPFGPQVEEDPFPFKPKPQAVASAGGTDEHDATSKALIRFNRVLKHMQAGDEAELRGYIEDVRALSPDEAENMEHRLNSALENMSPSEESDGSEDAQETIE